jgi:hypothetical protein
MSDTILGGDFTVYYLADTGGNNQITWTGSATGTRTVNELYSALNDLFDAQSQLDNGIPISAQTPSAYTIGNIDSGAVHPWFIDPVTIQHLTGGAITTTGWTRVTSSAPGILRFSYTVGGGADFVSGDVGKTVTRGTNIGTLLYYESDGSSGTAWIRPRDETSTHDWTGSGTVAVTAGTGSVTQDGDATTGNMLWSNIFTLGSIQDYTQLYIFQNDSKINPWWPQGQIDVLLNVVDQGTTIDQGLISVYARKPTTTYDYFQIDISGGGRNPVPLNTGVDLNDTDGYREATITGNSAIFTAGEIINGGTSGANAVLVTTDQALPATYYLITDSDGVYTPFTSGETVTGQTSGQSGTISSIEWINGAAAGNSDIVISHIGANTSYDINGDSESERYSIVVNCNSHTVEEVYTRLKYIQSAGNTAIISGVDGGSLLTVENQEYKGIDTFLVFGTTMTTPPTPGTQITGLTSAATAITVSSNTSTILTTNRKGSFDLAENVSYTTGGPQTATNITTNEEITPAKANPYGTFAGGRFFGQRGVVLTNVAGSDVNNYELIDNDGNVVAAPISVTFELTGLKTDSEVRIYDLDGNLIDGTESSTSTFSYVYQYTSDVDIIVVIHHLNWNYIRLTGLTLGASNQSIPIQQQTDRVYSNS